MLFNVAHFVKFLSLAVLCLTIQVFSMANAASFDCNKAATFVERTICANPELSTLDDLMANNYRVMKAAGIGAGAQSHLKQSQRDWIKVRNKCSGIACLKFQYLERSSEICEYPVITGVYPLGCKDPYDF
tara:strand:+ start:283 stop:672 length:390 start_codon:yes stop_codon:yes gene_type:complete